MTERTLTVTKNEDGTYRAERDGRVVVVPVTQRFGVEAIDRLRAEYEAVEAFSDLTVIQVIGKDGELQDDPEDRARVDAEHAELRAKLVAMKVAGYDHLVEQAGRNPPAELVRKRDYWRGQADASSHRR